jgi:hypothetical protein
MSEKYNYQDVLDTQTWLVSNIFEVVDQQLIKYPEHPGLLEVKKRLEELQTNISEELAGEDL